MTAPFPFGFPAATAMYLGLYVLTLMPHVLLLSYVLGGAALMMWRALCGMMSREWRQDYLAEVVVRDWLPFFLGAAITAGVAPLLFLQVLYKEHFYSANLLLQHRWMAFLPALIMGFYLLYLQKTERLRGAPPWVRLLVSVVAWSMFVFTASTWTENHLLALQGLETWVPFYVRQDVFYRDPALWPRLGVWLGGAVPLWATIVATQIWVIRRQRLRRPESPASTAQAFAVADNIAAESQRLPRWAIAGVVVAGICALSYPQRNDMVALVWQPLCRIYVFGGSVGVLLQIVGWWRMRHTHRIDGGVLALLWAGVLLTVLGTAVAREGVRLSKMDMTPLLAEHAKAAHMGGGGVFVVFAVVNALLIGWCLRQVARTPPVERKEVKSQ